MKHHFKIIWTHCLSDGYLVQCYKILKTAIWIMDLVNFTNSSLSLWSVTKKKPLCTVASAHCKPDNSSDECIPDESWITSIASLRSTDLLASGNTLACILFQLVLSHWRGGSNRTSSISHPPPYLGQCHHPTPVRMFITIHLG